ncbi:methyltransferase domain-containing protein [Amphritea sp. HPY]|uniref:class I SAM-dependent methyltransferase n=1 Tax=Amphritea sp. HPY TaxID=3421652 RepID=UPI003D7D4F63
MTIHRHYSDNLQQDQLLQQIRERYPDGADAYQLAPVDQLHIGGIKASQKLLQRLEQLKPKRILEIGSGLGGLMRLIRTSFDCDIIGIDITHDFNTLNRSLSGLSEKQSGTTTLTCDAQHLPFADDSFDCIIFQHSLLNIPDTEKCLQECSRVLGQNGSLLLHEVLQGSNHQAMLYPVPWARNADHSHLITAEQLQALLQHNGFAIDSTSNWTEEALQWRQRQAAKESNSQPVTTLSPAHILGSDFKKMAPNVMANLSSEAVQVWEVVAKLENVAARLASG